MKVSKGSSRKYADDVFVGQIAYDYTGNRIEHAADYFPYGKILREFVESDNERFLTTQHERDAETGLDYRGARYYDSDVARFLSLDPHAANYPSLSDYSYVAGNPIIFIDPDGKDIGKYTVNENGEVALHSTVESDEDYDMLYTESDWDNKVWDKGIRVDDRSLLKDFKIYGNSDDEKVTAKVYKFLAENTVVEWALIGGKYEGKESYQISTKRMTNLSPAADAYGMTDIKYHIHSHPNYKSNMQEEIESMGVVEDGVVYYSDWNVVLKIKRKNGGEMPYKYRVYMTRTKNLYYVDPANGGTFLRKVKKPMDIVR